MPLMPRGERGEGRLGTLFAIVVLLVGIYLGVKIVPVMINVYAFRDYLDEQARFAALPHHEDDVVKKNILDKARELDLPIGAKEVLVDRTGTRIDIKVKYSVPIKTPLHTFNWDFDEAISAPLF
ncbi:MAG TPA: hypothetical protein VFT43_00180 [Candidatus Polarisedimenticolia bacterium]|nr:hypothetical protein [Candidatus Polarisedimenticolia bacterium]